MTSDAHFWDRSSRKYAERTISDQVGYELTLDRTRALLRSGDSVLELGCGTGTTALRLAGGVREYLATEISSGMIAIADKKHAAYRIPALAFRATTQKRSRPVRRRSTRSWDSTISIWSATCLARCVASTLCLRQGACSSPRLPASAI